MNNVPDRMTEELLEQQLSMTDPNGMDIRFPVS